MNGPTRRHSSLPSNFWDGEVEAARGAVGAITKAAASRVATMRVIRALYCRRFPVPARSKRPRNCKPTSLEPRQGKDVSDDPGLQVRSTLRSRIRLPCGNDRACRAIGPCRARQERYGDKVAIGFRSAHRAGGVPEIA